MTYLINLSLTLLIFFSNLSFANDNKIIFEINNNIYSTLDFKYRVNYLEEINRIKYSPNLEKDLKNDFFNSVLFFEYVINNKNLNPILKTESKKIFEKIKNQFELMDNLKEEVILKNINYDYARKIVLEDLLNNYRDYIFSDPNDIDFIYNYRINYITFPIDNLVFKESSEKINKIQNISELTNYLNEKNIKYYLEQKEIKDLKKISNKIQRLINSDNKIYIEKNNNFNKIMIIEKNLEFTEGVFYRLINFETNEKLSSDNQNCNYVKSSTEIKSSKEYELNKLNENIKNNLKSINDFVIFESGSKLNYIFLCEIRVNEDFLKEVNINKKISITAKNIELDFINRYSKLYNAKKYY